MCGCSVQTLLWLLISCSLHDDGACMQQLFILLVPAACIVIVDLADGICWLCCCVCSNDVVYDRDTNKLAHVCTHGRSMGLCLCMLKGAVRLRRFLYSSQAKAVINALFE